MKTGSQTRTYKPVCQTQLDTNLQHLPRWCTSPASRRSLTRRGATTASSRSSPRRPSLTIGLSPNEVPQKITSKKCSTIFFAFFFFYPYIQCTDWQLRSKLDPAKPGPSTVRGRALPTGISSMNSSNNGLDTLTVTVPMFSMLDPLQWSNWHVPTTGRLPRGEEDKRRLRRPRPRSLLGQEEPQSCLRERLEDLRKHWHQVSAGDFSSKGNQDHNVQVHKKWSGGSLKSPDRDLELDQLYKVGFTSCTVYTTIQPPSTY